MVGPFINAAAQRWQHQSHLVYAPLPNGTDKYFVKSTRNINEFEGGKVACQKYEEFQVRALESGASIHQKAFSAV